MCRNRSSVHRCFGAVVVLVLQFSPVLGQEAGNDISESLTPRAHAAKRIGGRTEDNCPLPDRAEARKKELVKEFGGTEESEAAVAAALEWLALHQQADGSWSFDHRKGPCQSNPGSLADALNGATGMALLPFLGAGQTHKEGAYQDNIKRGLTRLVKSLKLKGDEGSLADSGTMYSHAIGTIALCEAYALTNDRELLIPAQAAINYIVKAQDPVGGGWRYQPKQPGDTSVTGWQVSALQTAGLTELKVPAAVRKGASLFLDSVQAEEGSAYGYTMPTSAPGTTSVGLLARIYLGWDEDDKGLQQGVERLGNLGPSKSNLYYNYYATQVMRHYGGDRWPKWNAVIRDRYVSTQAKEGPEKGSWFIPGNHGAEVGGRTYCTVMATLTLESYYRSLPLARE